MQQLYTLYSIHRTRRKWYVKNDATSTTQRRTTTATGLNDVWYVTGISNGMDSGVPAVDSDCGQNPETVNIGKNGMTSMESHECLSKCQQYALNASHKQPRYGGDRKYCNSCRRFIKWIGVYCPCCRQILRTRPRNGRSVKERKYIE